MMTVRVRARAMMIFCVCVCVSQARVRFFTLKWPLDAHNLVCHTARARKLLSLLMRSGASATLLLLLQARGSRGS